jgi:hypothetical protein
VPAESRDELKTSGRKSATSNAQPALSRHTGLEQFKPQNKGKPAIKKRLNTKNKVGSTRKIKLGK